MTATPSKSEAAVKIDRHRNQPRRMEPCAICGSPFYFKGGPKSRRTCPRIECRQELKRRSAPNYRGDSASLSAARGRSAFIKSGDTCEHCGDTAENRGRWIERHHVDGNPYNNAPENISILCKPCHRKAHGRAVRLPQSCVGCGERLPMGSLAKSIRNHGAWCRACYTLIRRVKADMNHELRGAA